MKQVKHRTWFCLLFTLLLLLGLGVFFMRYSTDGDRWAAFSANKHIYDQSGHLSHGMIFDRTGSLLYDASTASYHEDKTVRKATLHAVGDRAGNIAFGASNAYREKLSGFNPILGTTAGGHDLYLTVDASLNTVAYGALNGKKGTVGVYNYKTGEMLCMVSLPTFDPKNPPEIVEGDQRYEGVYLNRLLSATYTPGSVFKLVTTAAAIEKIDQWEERSFVCDGAYEIGEDRITCPKAHGELDLTAAFACSCNGFYAQLSQELGAKTLQNYTEKAGLLRAFSVSELPIAAGRFDLAEENSAQLGWAGVGQSTSLMNPCAMMTFAGTIANRGTQVLPRLISKESTASGLPGGFYSAQKQSGAMKSSTCNTLAEMMRTAVTDTYGQGQFGTLPVCAKSGTAEVGASERPHSWFVGFVDDSEHPLAFVVVVENGGSGASVAGGIAAKVLSAAVEAGY